MRHQNLDDDEGKALVTDLKRRSLLKLATGLLGLGITGVSLPSLARAPQTGGGRTLIAYFSRSGTTREVALQIQQHIGGVLFELKTVTPYPDAYRATTNQAKREQQANARPELTAEIQNMADFDTVLLGFPNWWGTLPMAFFTFLEHYDFTGKAVIPFCTHEGSGFGSSLDDLRTYCSKARILEGLALRGGGVDRVTGDAVREEVTQWLDGLAIPSRGNT